jgi:UDP-N-acetylmuramate dehydrogenase
VSRVEPLDAVVDAVVAAMGDRAQRGAPLGARTTYRVGGDAAVLVTAAGVEDLSLLASVLAGADVPVLVIGRGSNLLVADAGFAGVAVVLGDAFAEVSIDGVTVRAGAAAALPVVARQTVAAGLTGFEWAVGVPGAVGGAVRMNAGGHGAELRDSLRRVRILDLRTGEDGVVPAAALDLSYRSSGLTDGQVVVWAELGLAAGDRDQGETAMAEIVAWRRSHQPGGANAGSVFANPTGDHAGRLLDEAGARGRRRGSAAVSTRHANFIQADAGGSADDIRALMQELADDVAARFGVQLRPETRLVGFPGTPGGPPNPQVEVER